MDSRPEKSSTSLIVEEMQIKVAFFFWWESGTVGRALK